MNQRSIKDTDRLIYDSITTGDFLHSSWSAHTMYTIEQNWMEITSASMSQKSKARIGLELGCGAGDNLKWIARHSEYVIGLDHSIASLRKARPKIESDISTAIINGDAELLPIKTGKLGFIFCGAILHHLPDYARSLSELYKSLDNEGLVLATEPCAYNPFAVIRRKYFPSVFHTPDERPFPPNELIDAFKRNFDFVAYKRFFILSINSGIIEKFMGMKVARIYLKVAMIIDSVLLRIPVIRNLCWRISIIGIKRPRQVKPT